VTNVVLQKIGKTHKKGGRWARGGERADEQRLLCVLCLLSAGDVGIGKRRVLCGMVHVIML
jgi:hypothetical protein